MSTNMNIENNRSENEKLMSGFMQDQGISSMTLPVVFLDETPDEEHMFDWNGKEVAK